MKTLKSASAMFALLGVVATTPAFAQNTTASSPEPKKPHGCLVDGAVGAAGGHFVGQGHTKLGAAAGCAYGWHKKHEWKKEHKAWEKEKKAAQAPAPATDKK